MLYLHWLDVELKSQKAIPLVVWAEAGVVLKNLGPGNYMQGFRLFLRKYFTHKKGKFIELSPESVIIYVYLMYHARHF